MTDTKPEGPYKEMIGTIVGPTQTVPFYPSRDHLIEALNEAYAEGYKAGRASRDGLRAEIKRLQSVVGEVDYDMIDEALAEDEKYGK